MKKLCSVIPALKYFTWLLLLAASLSAKEDNTTQSSGYRAIG